MKKLYVTDLDGTLLDKNVTVPAESVRILRELDRRGVPFTYATARTIESVRHILSNVPVKYPVALMNGVLICDVADGEKYLFAAYLKDGDFEAVRKTLAECDVSPFMYFLVDEKLRVCYEKISNEYMENFMAERQKKYNKPFIRLENSGDYPGRPIYFASMDSEEKIRRANEACLMIPGIKTACYRDSYCPDFWYLEVFDEAASKKNAVLEIKRLTGAEEIISFGDNFNDLPMFEVSDLCYAAEGAPDGVKEAADGVFGTPEMAGVPKKIAELEGITLA
ncbi:MAG: HAD family phosphatase [Clostridia bacterium]|nr:HAD family phosphatase [Clostridia bacterium]